MFSVVKSGFSVVGRNSSIVLFGKWKGEPSGTIYITGKTGGRDYAEDIPVSAAIPLEANNIIPVSYTHLDVYKRQGIVRYPVIFAPFFNQ